MRKWSRFLISPEAPTKVYSVYAQDLPRKSLETFLYRITYNGHFWPEKWLKKGNCADCL